MKLTERGHLYGGPVLSGVPIRYEGATAVIIATGPSLTADQIMQCRYYHERNKLVVLGVNDAYRICDFLDYLYAADWRWIEYHKGKIQARLKRGFCFTTPEKGRKKHLGWREIPSVAKPGLSTERNLLHRGNNSGYQCINLAYLLGCNRILLLGFDHHSGGHHFFGKHPTPAMQVESNYSRWIDGYKSIRDQEAELGITVINCTPGSAIDAFPRISLNVALEVLEV